MAKRRQKTGLGASKSKHAARVQPRLELADLELERADQTTWDGRCDRALENLMDAQAHIQAASLESTYGGGDPGRVRARMRRMKSAKAEFLRRCTRF